MKAIFTYLTGGRAGQAVVVEKSYAMLGRAPQADVRFGPDHDLPVSGRHAAVVFRDGDWILRDLASTNGTFVNGERIKGEHQLIDQDLIRLGDGGPMLRFGILQDGWRPSAGQVVVPAEPTAEPELEPVAATTAVPKTPLSTAMPTAPDDGRFVAPVSATSRRAPWAPALLLVAVLGSLGGLAMWKSRASQGAVDERAVLLAQADSLFATLEAIGRRDTRISGALDGAKAETARLRSRIRRAPRDQQVLAPLRDSLDRLTTSFERLAAAAALDAQQIARTNEQALALVEATYEDGSRRVAAAFSARRRGGALVYVTVQDILADSAGHRPVSVTVQPAGAARPLPTRALAAQSALDVAILEAPRGSDAGTPPTLASEVGSALVGQASVLVGYPAVHQGAGGGAPAQATALAAVSIASEKRLQLEPLGGALAPGSPVFDRAGAVIGMLLPSTSDRLLDALPAPAIAAFLDGSPGDR
jgi:hypothetical protein